MKFLLTGSTTMYAWSSNESRQTCKFLRKSNKNFIFHLSYTSLQWKFNCFQSINTVFKLTDYFAVACKSSLTDEVNSTLSRIFLEFALLWCFEKKKHKNVKIVRKALFFILPRSKTWMKRFNIFTNKKGTSRECNKKKSPATSYMCNKVQ